MKLVIFLYVVTIFYALFEGHYLISIGIALTIPIAFWLKKCLKERKIEYFTKKIEEANNAQKKGKKYKPFLNINKEKWYIIELIPTIERVTAKQIANRARKQKFKTYEELSNFANFSPVIKDLLNKIILL